MTQEEWAMPAMRCFRGMLMDGGAGDGIRQRGQNATC